MVLDSDIFKQFSKKMDRYAALWDFMLEFIDFHPDAILLLDQDFKVVKGNSTAARYLNTTPDELEDKHLTELIPNVESSGRLDMYRQVYETGEALIIEGFQDKTNYGNTKFILRVLKINGGVAIIGTNIIGLKCAQNTPID